MTKSVYKCKLICSGHLGCRTKPIFKLGREFDKSNQYMKFGSNQVINDYGRVSTSAN